MDKAPSAWLARVAHLRPILDDQEGICHQGSAKLGQAREQKYLAGGETLGRHPSGVKLHVALLPQVGAQLVQRIMDGGVDDHDEGRNCTLDMDLL